MHDYYTLIKALHVIFVVTWFAGLFYTPRLFVYFIEAGSRANPERDILRGQYTIMARRLWTIIAWPSAMLASVFGLLMFYLMPAWLDQPWMQVKLCFVGFLYMYHIKCHLIFKELDRGRITWSSNMMRLWNEGPTVILFSVIFLVMMRDALGWVFGLLGLLGLMFVIGLGFKGYQWVRSKKSPSESGSDRNIP